MTSDQSADPHRDRDGECCFQADREEDIFEIDRTRYERDGLVALTMDALTAAVPWLAVLAARMAIGADMTLMVAC